MLKGFVSGEEKDIVRIPMKGKNLFNPDFIVAGRINGTTGDIEYSSNTTIHDVSINSITFSTSVAWRGFTTDFIQTSNKLRVSIGSFIGDSGATFNAYQYAYAQDKSFLGFIAAGSNAPEGTQYIRVSFQCNIIVTNAVVTNIMLNIGSTALPYEPYGYQNGWEVRDNQNRIIWGREDEFQTTTGTLPFKGYGLPVKVKSLLGNSVQNGTPTPDSPIMPEFVGEKTGNLFDKTQPKTITNKYLLSNGEESSSAAGWAVSAYIPVNREYITLSSVGGNTPSICAYDSNMQFVRGANYAGTNVTTLNISGCSYVRFSYVPSVHDNVAMLNTGSTALPYEPYGYKLPFTNAGQTTNVYLGQVSTVRRVKKLVLTGKENNFYNKNGASSDNSLYFIRFRALQEIPVLGSPIICTHLINTKTTPSVSVGINIGSAHQVIYINIGLDTINTQPHGNTVAGLKEYIASQYAAGTPVTVWYVLAEPETAIVNEPLAKIGDYADELNNTVATLPEIPTTTGQNTLIVDTTLAPSSLTIKGHIKEWQPENLLPVSKFEDLSDPSWWSGGYYIRYNNMPAGTYVMSTNMPEKDPGDVYFNGENALNVPYEGRPVSLTIDEGGSFYVLFFVDRGGYESILNGTFTITLIKSE